MFVTANLGVESICHGGDGNTDPTAQRPDLGGEDLGGSQLTHGDDTEGVTHEHRDDG